jgi:hypothetical protein
MIDADPRENYVSATPPFPPRGELAAEAFIQETNHEIEAEAARYAQLHPDDVGVRSPGVIRRALRRVYAVIVRRG